MEQMKRRSVLQVIGAAIAGLFGLKAAQATTESTNYCWASGGDAGGLARLRHITLELKSFERESPKIVIGRFVCWPLAGRSVFTIGKYGAQRHAWELIKPGEYILIEDRNEMGIPFHQEAFLALSEPDTSNSERAPVRSEPIKLEEFWARARAADFQFSISTDSWWRMRPFGGHRLDHWVTDSAGGVHREMHKNG